MRTLVTGSSGFVGRYCAEIMDTVPLGAPGAEVDIRNLAEVIAAVGDTRPQAVIHLAAQSSVAAAFADPVRTQEINFMGTLHLLLALRQTGFSGRFLYVSSGDCYGLVPDQALPVTESQPLRPRNPYAVSKVAAEALCYQCSQTDEFELVVARPFNQAGPRQSTNFVVADIGKQFSQVRRGKRPAELTVGDVEVTRDYTDVRDGVRALSLLLERGRNGEAYNICTGIERSVRDVIDLYSRTTGIPVGIRQASDRLRRAEQRRMKGSFEKLHAHTGWQPVIPLEQTLTDILNYWDKEQLE